MAITIALQLEAS